MPWNRMGLTVIKPHISMERNERRGKIAVLLSICQVVNEIWRKEQTLKITAFLKMESKLYKIK